MMDMGHEVSIRTFSEGDEEDWFRLLKEAYGSLNSTSYNDIRQLVRSKSFLRDGFFLAETEQGIIGCIRVKPLRRKESYELWDLAVTREHRQSRVPNFLVENALSYLRKVKAQFVRAHTVAMEPYVSTYIEYGFMPVRRILRIDWDLDEDLPRLPTREDIPVKDAFLSSPEKIARVFVKALAPFWDWWIDDHGGPEELAQVSEGWFRNAKFRERWFAAEVKGELVGLTGFTIGEGEMGNFFGVMVLSEYRMRRIGSTLMQVAIKEAKEARLKTLRVFTVAFQDRLAPAAILYLKSGGKITAEFVQLEKKKN